MGGCTVLRRCGVIRLFRNGLKVRQGFTKNLCGTNPIPHAKPYSLLSKSILIPYRLHLSPLYFPQLFGTRMESNLPTESVEVEPIETTTLFPSTHGTELTTFQENALLSQILNESGITTLTPSDYTPSSIYYNFILLSALFSANHGAVVSCLSLATARLGTLGSYQSSVLYMSYTLSALIGATFVVKSLGARDSIRVGMWIYCIYVACFLIATIFEDYKEAAALTGAFVGGIGGGFLWTAQGSYFARASEEYALAKSLEMDTATSILGGLFAGIYLGGEVVMRLCSTILIQWGWSWSWVFGWYTLVAIGSALLMGFTADYPMGEEEEKNVKSQTTFYKSTVTFRLLLKDPKMKYMIPLSGTFALSSVYITTFVNAEVVRVSLKDSDSTFVGLMTSITALVGGIMSVVFGFSSRIIGNSTILIIGCAAFFSVACLFVVYPDLDGWKLSTVALVYCLQGVGRATFEGTLKAEFAEKFNDKEAAFGNIIFQNGLITTLGFIMAANNGCKQITQYCIKFHDGLLHNVLLQEVLIMCFAVLAVIGYRRAKYLYEKEREEHELQSRLLGEDHLL